MTMISTSKSKDFFALKNVISNETKGATLLEYAAQKYIDIIYEKFKDSIVLVRLFATIQFKDLPKPNQIFVNKLAKSAGIASLIKDNTFILSLLGTNGENQQWKNRYNSKGHIGIPLASSDFIEEIPMMSRLLKELGLGLDWIDADDTKIVSSTIGKMSGMFYVPDAKITTDKKGRKIIVADDFVSKYGVKTVFGIGGGYVLKPIFLTNILVFLFLLYFYLAL